MTTISLIVLLSIGLIGFSVGIFFIYIVIMRRPGIDAINKGKMGLPIKAGGPLSNRINFLWYGICLAVLFGAMIVGMIMEYL